MLSHIPSVRPLGETTVFIGYVRRGVRGRGSTLPPPLRFTNGRLPLYATLPQPLPQLFYHHFVPRSNQVVFERLLTRETVILVHTRSITLKSLVPTVSIYPSVGALLVSKSFRKLETGGPEEGYNMCYWQYYLNH